MMHFAPLSDIATVAELSDRDNIAQLSDRDNIAQLPDIVTIAQLSHLIISQLCDLVNIVLGYGWPLGLGFTAAW